MTIEEYSTLMGYEETCEMAEYEKANGIYMIAGNMEKREFCEAYREVKGNPLVESLADAANDAQMAWRGRKQEERGVAHDLISAADELRGDGYESSADLIEASAAQLIGRADCIRWKIDCCIPLSEADNEFIEENL